MFSYLNGMKADSHMEYLKKDQDSSDQMVFFQTPIVQFWWVCENNNLSFLLLAAVEAHLLQDLMCFVFIWIPRL